MGLSPCPAVLAAVLAGNLAGDAARSGTFPDVQDQLAALLGLPKDDAGLIALVRQRTPAPIPPTRLAVLVAGLSSANFAERDRAERELIRGGPAVADAMAALPRPDDPEAWARRDRVAEAVVEVWRPERVADYKTAIKLLARRCPDGIADVFPDVLPVLGEDGLTLDVWQAMDRLVVRAGSAPAGCETVSTDDHPAKRALAAYLLTRRGTARQRDLGRRALADPDTTVRLRAAQGLLGTGDPMAVPALIDLLDKKPRTMAWQAEEMLAWSAGANAPTVVLGGGGNGDKVQRAWQAAWDWCGSKLLNGPKDSWTPKRPLLALVWGEAVIGWARRPRLVGANGATRWEWNVDRGIAIGQILTSDRILGASWPTPKSMGADFVRWVMEECKPTLETATLAGRVEGAAPINLYYRGLGSSDGQLMAVPLMAGWALVAGRQTYGFVPPTVRRMPSWVDVPAVIGRRAEAAGESPIDDLVGVDGDVLWYENRNSRAYRGPQAERAVIGLSSSRHSLLHSEGRKVRFPGYFVDPAGGSDVMFVIVDNMTLRLTEGPLGDLSLRRDVRVTNDYPVSIQFPVMRLGFGKTTGSD